MTLYNPTGTWGKGMSRKIEQKYLCTVSITEEQKEISNKNASQRIYNGCEDNCQPTYAKVECGLVIKALLWHIGIWASLCGRGLLKDFKQVT